MGKRHFISAILLTVLLLAAANGAIHVVSGHSPARRQVDAVERSSGANCIVLGNSLLATGFDQETFDRTAASIDASARSLNAAVGATMPVEHLLLLRLALRTNPHPSVVIYGFFDFQLTDSPAVRSDELIGNRNIGIFLEPREAERFYVMDPATSIKFRLLRDLPMYVERGNPYGRVELLRRRLRGIGLDSSVADASVNLNFAQLEAADPATFVRHCREVIEKHEPLSPPIQEINHESLASGARIVFVQMPLSPTHIQEFYDLPGWDAYQSYVRDMLTANGAEFLDASRWMPGASDFADRLHMTQQAAAEFSQKLAEAIYGPTSEPPR
jgi:hypothetical protein